MVTFKPVCDFIRVKFFTKMMTRELVKKNHQGTSNKIQ